MIKVVGGVESDLYEQYAASVARSNPGASLPSSSELQVRPDPHPRAARRTGGGRGAGRRRRLARRRLVRTREQERILESALCGGRMRREGRA